MTDTVKIAAPTIVALALRERAQALSPREWKHRLAGYGYAIRDTDRGQVVETLTDRVEVAVLPADPTR